MPTTRTELKNFIAIHRNPNEGYDVYRLSIGAEVCVADVVTLTARTGDMREFVVDALVNKLYEQAKTAVKGLQR